MKFLLFFIVPGVFAASANKKIEKESLVVAGTFGCNIFFPNASTTLSCGDVTVSSPASKPPKVEWFIGVREDEFKSSSSHTFLPLNNTLYWHHKEQLHLCEHGVGHYPHPKGPSSYDCSRKKSRKDSTEVYTCDYTSRGIIPMSYRCKISTFEAGNAYKTYRIKHIAVKSRLADDGACNVVPACFIPSPVNMSASRISGSAMNLTWQSSPRVPFSECTRPYCNGSRRYKVYLKIFDSLASEARPIHKFGWLKTGKRRDTFLVFRHQTAVNQYFYYRYSVRNINVTPEHSKDPNVSTHKKSKMSDLCHFSNQNAAVIDKPPRDVVFNVSQGSHVTVTCQASGFPLPRVELLWESPDTSHNSTLKEGVSIVQHVELVYNRMDAVFYCRTTNTIIHPLPCGQPLHTEVTRKIRITVH